VADFWTPDIEQRTIKAINAQLVDFARIWGRSGHIYLNNKPHPRNAWPIIIDNRPIMGRGNAKAVGVHRLGFVHISVTRSLSENSPVSWAIDHEVLEAIVDPGFNRVVRSPYGLIHVEICDPVAWLPTYVLEGVVLTNFVTRAWFGRASGPWDYLGALSAPWQVVGYVE
jgi:hypothetical protein